MIEMVEVTNTFEHDDMSEEPEDHIASVPLIFALVGRVQIQPALIYLIFT
jgi:hypothetical protein